MNPENSLPSPGGFFGFFYIKNKPLNIVHRFFQKVEVLPTGNIKVVSITASE
jgi:hypothetical protein